MKLKTQKETFADDVKHIANELKAVMRSLWKNPYVRMCVMVFALLFLGTVDASAQGAIPTAIADAIDSMELVGAAAFAALVVISLPFIAWGFVKRTKR